MARKLQLTWDIKRGRWKKVYKGRQLYFAFGNNKKDMVGYEQAWAAFCLKKIEIDAEDEHKQSDKPHAAEYRKALDNQAKMLDWMTAHIGEDEGYAELIEMISGNITRLQKQFAMRTPPPLELIEINPVVFMEEPMRTVWVDRLLRQDHEKAKSPIESVQGNMERYLSTLLRRAKSDDVSHSYVQRVKHNLGRFVEHVGAQSKIANIKAATLSTFRDKLLDEIENDSISSAYASGIIRAAKTFIKWAWREELIESLPRNFDAMTIAEEIGEIETFTVDEIATLLSNASDRTKLYILLMLNTGMTPMDIAHLKNNEVDWKQGRITRKRTKTKKMKTVPTVEYPLFSETFRLLQQERNEDKKPDALALVNKNGTPLRVVVAAGQGGKDKNINNVASAWYRLCKKNKINKPLKFLRRTGATMLEKHELYGRYAAYFLGKSAKSDAEKRYAQPSREQFDKAVKWLETQLIPA